MIPPDYLLFARSGVVLLVIVSFSGFLMKNIFATKPVYIIGGSGSGKTHFLMAIYRQMVDFKDKEYDKGYPDLQIHRIKKPKSYYFSKEARSYFQQLRNPFAGTAQITEVFFKLGNLEVDTMDYPGDITRTTGDIDENAKRLLLQQQEENFKKYFKTIKENRKKANFILLMDPTFITEDGDIKTGDVLSYENELKVDLRSMVMAIFGLDYKNTFEDAAKYFRKYEDNPLKNRIVFMITKGDKFADKLVKKGYKSMEELMRNDAFNFLRKLRMILPDSIVMVCSAFGDKGAYFDPRANVEHFYPDSEPWGIIQPFHFIEMGSKLNNPIWMDLNINPTGQKKIRFWMNFIVLISTFAIWFTSIIGG